MHMEAFQKKYGIKLGFMSAFCKAASYALQDQPVVNAVIEENVSIFRGNTRECQGMKTFSLNFKGNCVS